MIDRDTEAAFISIFAREGNIAHFDRLAKEYEVDSEGASSVSAAPNKYRSYIEALSEKK